MPYDEGLAQRIRELSTDEPGITEKKMFGGFAEDDDSADWLDRGLAFVRTLPPK